ncbi:MAG: bacterioferritin-associated ferredoxin [Gemmatimonadales bacterium]
MPIAITHCICHDTAFAALLPAARERNWSLDDLTRETGCGTGCGLCRPYLRRMLETGQTVFREIILE